MQPFERLQLIRRKLGETQESFAKGLGVKRGSYSDIERGKVKHLSESMLMLLELNFGISRKWIETGEGPERTYEVAVDKSLLKEAEAEYRSRIEAGDAILTDPSYIVRLLSKKDKVIAEQEKELFELRELKKRMEQIIKE